MTDEDATAGAPAGRAGGRGAPWWWHPGAVTGFYLVVVVWATWPVAARITSGVRDLGDPLLQAFELAWVAEALRTAPLDVFHAPMFHPLRWALATTENLIGAGVPAAPLFWLSGNAILMLNTVLLASYTAGAVGTYLLVRDVTGSRWAALPAGIAFAVAPYRLSQVSHLHVVAVHLLPFALWAALRLRRQPSWRGGALLGLLVAWQAWTSLTGAAITAVAVGVWLAGEVAVRRRQALATVGRAAAGLLLAALLAAPLAMAYLTVRAEYPEARRGEATLRLFSARPGSYLAPADVGPVTAPLYAPLRRAFLDDEAPHEKLLFPGLWLVVAGLAGVVVSVAGAVRAWRAGVRAPPEAADGLTFVAIAGAGFVLSLGPRLGEDGLPLPLGLIAGLTGNLMRVPARFATLVLLAMAVLAGVAVARVGPRLRTRVAAASTVLLLAEFAPPAIPLEPAPPVTSAHRAVATRDGAVLALPTLEVSGGGHDFGSFAREGRHLYRATAHFRPLTNGYSAFVPEGYAALAARLQDLPSRRSMAALRAAGVRTVIVETDLIAGTPWEGVDGRLEVWPGVSLLGVERTTRVYGIAATRARRPAR